MRLAGIGLALVLALALQTTLAPLVAGPGTPVDLVLVVVVAVAIAGGPVAGLWSGTVGGLLQDALSGGVIGVGGLAKTLVGYLIGLFGSRFDIARLWHRLLVFFVASLAHTGCFVGVYGLLSGEGSMTSLTASLTQAAANALIGVAVAVAAQIQPVSLERRRRRDLTRRFGRFA